MEEVEHQVVVHNIAIQEVVHLQYQVQFQQELIIYLMVGTQPQVKQEQIIVEEQA